MTLTSRAIRDTAPCSGYRRHANVLRTTARVSMSPCAYAHYATCAHERHVQRADAYLRTRVTIHTCVYASCVTCMYKHNVICHYGTCIRDTIVRVCTRALRRVRIQDTTCPADTRHYATCEHAISLHVRIRHTTSRTDKRGRCVCAYARYVTCR